MSPPNDPARPRGPSRRLFFALWPDAGARASLALAIERCVPARDCRPQRPDQWHVTLQFLGDVPDARLLEVRSAGAETAAAGRPAAFELDRLEHWARPEVLCLAATSVPESLTAMVQRLRAALRARGFEPDGRPWKPHATLARGVVRAPPAPDWLAPVRFPVQRIALVQSVTDRSGARYVEIDGWDLPG
ncbi:MAG: RNA 2',3'-cyclic phosphodiesterase [Steroidobacteraceae bacterium]